ADSAVGPAGGVVSPETGKRPPETQNVDAQSTFTLEIAVGMWNRSGKTASNLQHGKYQDLIRGSLGFPLQLVGGERNYVIVRHGTIARIGDMLAGTNKNFLVDTFIFPGNSGGPVILKPEMMA